MAYDPMEGFITVTRTAVINYSDFGATTMNFISDYENLGICNSVSNGDGTYSYSPITATKSATVLPLIAY